ncbi:hypothetical protein B7494_g7354 [Chlorociboria aeruginascens]|nr:hypothetical protein B7494_g7354 [Chlorociboria aeruginascens]
MASSQSITTDDSTSCMDGLPPWGKFRDKIIENQALYDNTEFQNEYASNFSVNWPYDLIKALVFEEGQIKVSVMMDKYLSDLSHISMRKPFRDKYPEFKDLASSSNVLTLNSDAYISKHNLQSLQVAAPSKSPTHPCPYLLISADPIPSLLSLGDFFTASVITSATYITYTSHPRYINRTTTNGRCILAKREVEFHGLFMDTNGPITYFETTMVIPSPPSGLQADGQINAVWPGMQPCLDDNGNNSVLQNVVANEGTEKGEWYLIPFFCCSPPTRLTHNARVYPGYSLNSKFTLLDSSGRWLDEWSVDPGPDRIASGESPFSGNLTWDPMNYTQKHSPYQIAAFVIELQYDDDRPTSWDFGPVVWKNTTIESETSTFDWCRYDSDSIIINGSDTWEVASYGNRTRCIIDEIRFESMKPSLLRGI